jgi:hypothetical protein
MAELFGKLLFGLVRFLVEDWLKQAALKMAAWLDTRIHRRTTKITIGGLLGLAAYFIIPIVIGLF